MLEHPPQLSITQSELTPRVADYFDNLLAQRDVILERYELTPETAGRFCNLRSADEDRETMLALYENMVYVLEHKEIPPSELLEQERINEQQRINAFFGEDADIEVPQLPKTITPERIEQWRKKRFELRYLPPLTLEEGSEYPGWKKKPTEENNLFNNLDQIQHLPKNQHNPHLNNLAPNQLAGCWMLIDTRPKPNYQYKGTQTYEDDDAIKTIIQQLVQEGIVNSEAQDGRRNLIHPKKMDHPEFWQPFYEYLSIDQPEDNAIIRLPRVIEQSMFGQGKEWDGTTTWEWSEEYYQASLRLMVGDVDCGGVSDVRCYGYVDVDVGFRFLVVFSSP